MIPAAVVVGVGYAAAPGLHLSLVAHTAWKGAAVGLLALYAGWRARDADGWLLCVMLGLSAVGDVLTEAAGLVAGAFAYLAAHLFALTLYLRNRRPVLPASQWAPWMLMVGACAAIAWGLPAFREIAWAVALYGLALSAMGAGAWLSRFPRDRVGLGALMLVCSGLLAIGRMGPLSEADWLELPIWGAYLAGQVLVCLGVTRGAVSLAPGTK